MTLHNQESGRALPVILLVATAVALWLYRPFGLYFLNDDLIHVPQSIKGIWGQHNSIRLLNEASIRIDGLLFGKHATGYHAVNLLIHMAVALLLWIWLRQPGIRKLHGMSPISMAATAVFFFVYPLHSESVFWILGRGSMLAVLWMLIAVILISRSGAGWLSHILACISFAAALFTYESVWIFPTVAVVLWHWLAKDEGHAVFKPGWLIAFTVIFGCFLLYRYRYTGEWLGAYEWSARGQGWQVLPMHYIKLFVRAYTPPHQSAGVFVSIAVVLGMLLCGLFGMDIRRNRQTAKWTEGLLILFAISLLPYITLGIDTRGTESERFLYLPTLFLCTAIAGAISRLRGRNMQLMMWTIILLACLLFLSRSGSGYRMASEVVRQSLSVIGQSGDASLIRIEGLPEKIGGAVALRTGLPEGIAWLSPEAGSTPVEVISSEVWYRVPLRLELDLPDAPAKTGDTLLMRYTPGRFRVTH